jgi:hypothetical protein
MQAAVPRSEVDLFNSRMTDLMSLPSVGLPEELQPIPVRPLVEVRFPGLTELFSR